MRRERNEETWWNMYSTMKNKLKYVKHCDFFLSLPTHIQIHIWLVVWTPLKNISQLGWLFLIYGKIKHVPNHQPAYMSKVNTNVLPLSNLRLHACEEFREALVEGCGLVIRLVGSSWGHGGGSAHRSWELGFQQFQHRAATKKMKEQVVHHPVQRKEP